MSEETAEEHNKMHADQEETVKPAKKAKAAPKKGKQQASLENAETEVVPEPDEEEEVQLTPGATKKVVTFLDTYGPLRVEFKSLVATLQSKELEDYVTKNTLKTSTNLLEKVEAAWAKAENLKTEGKGMKTDFTEFAKSLAPLGKELKAAAKDAKETIDDATEQINNTSSAGA